MLSLRFFMFLRGRAALGTPPKSARVATARKYGVLLIKLALEALNEHLAAEVCRVTVASVRSDRYLQHLRTCHFDSEQTAAEGRRVTVHTCSFPVYLRCFRTSTSTVFLR